MDVQEFCIIFASSEVSLAPYYSLLFQGEESNPTQTCVELLCETDLFLYYIQEVDASVFQHMQGQQKLIMDYTEYHRFIIKIILKCLSDPHTYAS